MNVDVKMPEIRLSETELKKLLREEKEVLAKEFLTSAKKSVRRFGIIDQWNIERRKKLARNSF